MVRIAIDSIELEGNLVIPPNAQGMVVFAHGSGSSRHSPRNNYVAQALQKNQLATLLLDLLSPKEDVDFHTRFDIELLTQRLLAATNWLKEQKGTQDLPLGYFGASTGAAAALKAAALLKDDIKAVVSRGGRPDLAYEALEEVEAPTLLIVGGEDDVVIDLNEKASSRMKGEREIVIIPGATHLFEEPGALEEVASLAADWLKQYLVREKMLAQSR